MPFCFPLHVAFSVHVRLVGLAMLTVLYEEYTVWSCLVSLLLHFICISCDIAEGNLYINATLDF